MQFWVDWDVAGMVFMGASHITRDVDGYIVSVGLCHSGR